MIPVFHRVALLCLLFLVAGGLNAQSNVEVEGMGLFGDRKLENRLAFLMGVESSEPAELDSVILEDCAFLLLEQVKRDGYLKPDIHGVFSEGTDQEEFLWSKEYSIQLPVDYEAEYALFEVRPGKLYIYDEVEVVGAEPLEKEEAERFFIPGGALFERKKSRVFTPENFERRVQRLMATLDSMGYREVRVVGQTVEMDDASGAVAARVEIETGPLHRVGDIEVLIDEQVSEHDGAGALFTREWEQAMRLELRNQVLEEGYPDVRVELVPLGVRDTANGEMLHQLRFIVKKGPKVELSSIRFEGDEATRRSVLRRQVSMETGQALNVLEASQGRRKLMGLGIYKEVDVDFKVEEEGRRSTVYSLTPSVRKNLGVQAGWGSYEMARVGLDWEHRNAFGRAHRYGFELKQSIRSSRAVADYSIPQIFGTGATAYVESEYRYREEISYTRSSRGAAVGFSNYFANGIRLTAEYSFDFEDTDRDDPLEFQSEENARVASVRVRASYDRRDDFLAPTSGYYFYGGLEIANRYFGGSVDFNKFELGGSCHFAITESTLFHSGLRFGTVLTTGEAAEDIPFNSRFFAGGENSVRGYLEGEASPIDSSGDIIGAETFMLLNLELEQRLFERLSVVLFFDGLTQARDGFFEDEAETVYSVGTGLRYTSPVGPIRLEYGYNPDPRENDRSGAVHFSLGFPF